MLKVWRKVPEHSGYGRPPTALKPEEDWYHLQIIKERRGSKLINVKLKAIFGHIEKLKPVLGVNTAYVERTNLTSQQMNGRLVRKTLSFSKALRRLEAASAIEDAFYNFTRPFRTLRVELEEPTGQAHWQQRTEVQAAGLTNHVWTVKELLHLVLVPLRTNN
jgi:hypothetical protein